MTKYALTIRQTLLKKLQKSVGQIYCDISLKWVGCLNIYSADLDIDLLGIRKTYFILFYREMYQYT